MRNIKIIKVNAFNVKIYNIMISIRNHASVSSTTTQLEIRVRDAPATPRTPTVLIFSSALNLMISDTHIFVLQSIYIFIYQQLTKSSPYINNQKEGTITCVLNLSRSTHCTDLCLLLLHLSAKL